MCDCVPPAGVPVYRGGGEPRPQLSPAPAPHLGRQNRPAGAEQQRHQRPPPSDEGEHKAEDADIQQAGTVSKEYTTYIVQLNTLFS